MIVGIPFVLAGQLMKISEIAKTKQRHGKQLYHLIYTPLFIVNWFLMALREQREYLQS